MSDLFFRLFKHLLPRARAWRITIDKTLRQFFVGLSGLGTDVSTFFDNIWSDVWPSTTRELDAWEKEFGLPEVGLSDADRRTRLASTWSDTGGQSPSYIQSVIHGAGFTDVFVYDSFCATLDLLPVWRIPQDYEDKGAYAIDNITTIGQQTPPSASTDPATFPYYVYIGPDPINAAEPLTIDTSRKRELETLLCKLRPTHDWVMVYIRYRTEDSFRFSLTDTPNYDESHGFADDSRTIGGRLIDR